MSLSGMRFLYLPNPILARSAMVLLKKKKKKKRIFIYLFLAVLGLHLEKAMAPHSSTLVWKIPWTEDPGGLQSMGLQRVGQTEWLHFHFSLSHIGKGNVNTLQCSCLENPRDRGAWWAAIYGVAQSQTRLNRLSSSSSNRFINWWIGYKFSYCNVITA